MLVVTPDGTHRAALAALIAAQSPSPQITGRSWLTEHAALAGPDVSAWRRAGSDTLVPLVPAHLLAPSTGDGACGTAPSGGARQ